MSHYIPSDQTDERMCEEFRIENAVATMNLIGGNLVIFVTSDLGYKYPDGSQIRSFSCTGNGQWNAPNIVSLGKKSFFGFI